MFYEIINKQPVALGQPESENIQTFADTSLQDTEEIGSIMLFSSNKIPDSYLICNGQSLSKSEYSELYSVIGGVFGETSTTFNLPDLREVAVAGVNTDYTLGTYKKDSFKRHTHLQCSHTHTTGTHTHTFRHVHVPQSCEHEHCTNPNTYYFYNLDTGCYCRCGVTNNCRVDQCQSCYSLCGWAGYCNVSPSINPTSVGIETSATGLYTSSTGSSDGITRGKRIGMYYIIKARSE